MPNPNGNIATLHHFKSPWNNPKTRTIRVPIVLATEVLEYARRIDANPKDCISPDTAMLTTDRDLQARLKDAVQVLDDMVATSASATLTRARKLKLSEISILLYSLVDSK